VQTEDMNSQSNPQQESREEPIPPPAVLYFYADGCPHCTKFASVWEQASEELKKRDFLVKTFSADDPTTKHMKIEGFPTILYINGPNAVPVKYTGARTLESVLRFAESKGNEM